MALIRGDNLGPEYKLKASLKIAGLNFLANCPSLPGKPDILFEQPRLAVQVHGCFWHGCPRHFRLPKRNREWWSQKIAANKQRDARTTRALRRLGYRVMVVWECELKKGVNEVVNKIARRVFSS